MTFRLAGEAVNTPREVLVAATPMEMRGLLDDFTNETIKGNISPDAFTSGLLTLGEAGHSPNFTARQIKNTLKNPLARMLVESPGMAKQMAESSVGLLDQFGINSDAAKSYIGPGMKLLTQAKKDGILKSDVTDEEVAREIQRPLHSALQSWHKDNKDNQQLHDYLGSENPGWNPTGQEGPITRQEALMIPFLKGY
jgi:hypothetical protein